MAKTHPTFDLRALAKARLRRLSELDPDELVREKAEAEAQGYNLIALPGLRILIRKPGPGEDE